MTEDEIEIILHACKTVLIYDNQTWKKKSNKDMFDIPMGSYHGAEICDLVGLYILNELSDVLPESTFGLYRDDGLAVTNMSRPCKLEQLNKKIRAMMNNIGFKITIDVGKMKTNFLDISLDLDKDTYSPYRKPNSKILYINSQSNHPQHIKHALPKMVQKRLSTLSKTEIEFDKAKDNYELALKKSGYNSKLKFTKGSEEKRKRTRPRKCIFYNPPFCKSVRQNIGKAFLRLVEEYFDDHHHYNKIFNRSTIKVSYSCMRNMRSYIQSHNKKVVSNNNSKATKSEDCNCRNRKECPLNGKCQIANVVYEATVTAGPTIRKYVGSTGNAFKQRYYGHTESFRNEKSKLKTELSKFIWTLKEKRQNYKIDWKILEKTHKSDGTLKKICETCNLEKIHIARQKRAQMLNKRSELIAKCPHYRKLYFHLPKKKKATAAHTLIPPAL